MNVLNYRRDIDGLRGIAILTVVLFHAGVPFVGGGFIGVDIFFVISGYLITTIVSREVRAGKFTIRQFYERRIRRILPAYVCVVLGAAIAAFYILPPAAFYDFSASAVASGFFASNFWFAGQMNYFQDAAKELPLLHLWSLSVEEQFYVVWPIALIVLVRYLSPRQQRWLLWAGIVLGVALTEWAIRFKSDTMVFFYTPFRFWELLIGATLAVCPPREISNGATRTALAILAIATMFLPAVLYTERQAHFPGVASLIPCLGAALVIYLGSSSSPSPILRVFTSRWLVGLGLISYSLYLWHWPIFALHHAATGAELTGADTVMALALALMVATLSWRYVEAPFRHSSAAVQQTRMTVMRPFAAAAMGIAVVAVLGVVGIGTGGFPQRADAAAIKANTALLEGSQRGELCLRNRDLDDLDVPRSGCSLGADAVAKAVLWGDSHANAYAAAIAHVARAEGMAVEQLTMQECSVTVTRSTADATAGRATRACAAFNDKVLQYLEQMPQITKVYIASYWLSSYVELNRLNGTEDAAALGVRDQEALDRQGTALSHLVDQLNRMGKHVVLLGQTPVFPNGGGRCVAQRAFMRVSLSGCAVSRAWHELVVGPANAMLSVVANGRDNVQFVDPTALFCTATSCSPAVNGIPQYRDKHHLNQLGSEMVAKLLSAPVVGFASAAAH